METILEMSGAVKQDERGNAVLRMADFKIARGEHICVYGLSNAERTALARLIGGLTMPDEGMVTVLGHDLRNLSDREMAEFRNRHIGYVSSATGFCRDMTVLQNIVLPLSICGIPRTKQRELGLSTLDKFGLAYAAFAYPRGLSIYEARLAALVRAIITRPELLILDDVFMGLDENKTDKLADALNSLDQKTSMLALSGCVTEALSADSIIQTKYGRIVRD